VVLEAERDESDVMTRPPRDPDSPLLSRHILLSGFLQGALAILAVCGIFLFATFRGLPPAGVRSMGFVTLVCANYALIFANRSFSASPLAAFARPNPSLWISAGSTAGALAAIFLVPAIHRFLHLGPLSGGQVLLCIAAALALLCALELIKLAARRNSSEINGLSRR
jgi:Ca2+-transporting ATPase